jgi:hypothetical protein
MTTEKKKLADLKLQPEQDQQALAEEKGFEDVHEMMVSEGAEEEDPTVEIFIPVKDANDIIVPGLGRTVKVKQSSIDAFNERYKDVAGLSTRKYVPSPDDIVE